MKRSNRTQDDDWVPAFLLVNRLVVYYGLLPVAVLVVVGAWAGWL